MIRAGQFRSDLYYRLNVFPVTIAPLRDRREDIPLLVKHFVDVFGRRMGKNICHISPETMAALASYDWPGNGRELQNLIERAVILSNNGLLFNPLQSQPSSVEVSRPATTLMGSERILILEALEQTGGVVGGAKGAATRLGVRRTTLLHKMKRLGIARPSSHTA